jgi:16S rRNA G527 N7-methylase RsmG
VERKQRKATFLQRSVVVLGLKGVEVVHGDASEVAKYERFQRQLDIVVSFAVAGPDEMGRLAEPFLKPGGHYCAMRPRNETAQPSRIGRFLSLEGIFDRQYGRFCVYRRDAAADTDASSAGKL